MSNIVPVPTTPQAHGVHKVDLGLYYDEFVGERFHKYLVATSSEGVYLRKDMMDSNWTELWLPFESSDVYLGNKTICFRTARNKLILNSAFHVNESLRAVLKESKISNPEFVLIDEFKLVDYCYEKFDIPDTVMRSYEYNKITCDSLHLYIEMSNGLLICLSSSQNAPGVKVNTDFMSHNERIMFIEGASQSEKVMIVTTSNKIYGYHFQTLKLLNRDEITSSITSLVVSPVCAFVTTQDNKLYVIGDDSNGSTGGVQQAREKFLPTLIQFKEKIVQVKCGYIHSLILLDSGEVYATGYNDLKQCCISDPPHIFTKTELVLREKDHPRSLQCSSRGSVFLTDTEAIFVGEVVHKFQTYSNYQLRVPLGAEFNDVRGGGWQYVVFKSCAHPSKMLNFFWSSLKQRANDKEQKFHDILFEYL
ncbi:hypothetical protein C9374_011998 [Naegleria lovaniensis]|uniref:Uncharacterized protein n=1 Tax=Naegleria lovaniensis TaxID=51637 RepID=A0AA88KC55_NAELO|nr:uncharacterized protein C9374_011998 [Naegleria lovaniensis]KAG2373535.1 hypothetical protein C9374_011998 [Naegleria lovaniensis]